ncbi:hypothetical protein PENTCL1PPCAC_14986, partial [Pristionchus entomophagus]
AGIVCKHVHSALLYSSHQDVDSLPALPPTILQQRNRDINLTHDYLSHDDPMPVDLPLMDDPVLDEEEEERERREQQTAQLYQDAYRLLLQSKRRIEKAKRNN